MLAESEWPSFLDWLPDGLYLWDAWVAIGTILVAGATATLAIATWRLARQTKRDVDASTESASATRQSAEAAQRSVEVAERALAAGIRPVLTKAERPPSVDREGPMRVLVKLSLRNVGSGIALIRESRWLGRIPPGSTLHVTTTGTAVPSMEPIWLMFAFICGDAKTAAEYERELVEQGFEVDVRYQDMNGDQPARIKARSTTRDGPSRK